MGTRDRDSRAIEELREYGASLVDSVPANRVDSVAMRTLARRGRRRKSPRMVVVPATIGLLLVSNMALASVSDGAAPGDFLYPIDRGYEWARDRFGAADRTVERLAESVVLAERGETNEAIELLSRELATPSSDEDAIAAAIEQLEDQVQRGNESQADQGANQGSGQGNDGRPTPSTPAATAPGQEESPSATAPGQIKDEESGGNPGNDPPGQTNDDGAKHNGAKDEREANPPGQDKDKSERSSPGGADGNGNSGNGNSGS